DVVGICNFVVIEILKQIKSELFEFCSTFWCFVFHVALILVPDVIPMDSLVTDDETDQVSRIGQTSLRGQIHWPIKTRINQERLQNYRRDLAVLWVIGLIVFNDFVSFVLQRWFFASPTENIFDGLSGSEGRKNRWVRLRLNGLHKHDVRQHRFLVQRQ